MKHVLALFLIQIISACLSAQIFGQEFQFCDKVLDGDTFRTKNGEKIRLIGVDTPEFFHPLKPVQFYTKESTLFARKTVEGKRIRLEFDQEKRDKYDRLLAYVYLEDSTFVNAELIKQGYAFAYTKYPFKYKEEFKEYEKQARKHELGLWKGKGEMEMRWLEKQGRTPFRVYEMAGGYWGIRYGKYMKPRVKSEDLTQTLENLRLWINEFSPRDLQKQLFEDGWLRVE